MKLFNTKSVLITIELEEVRNDARDDELSYTDMPLTFYLVLRY